MSGSRTPGRAVVFGVVLGALLFGCLPGGASAAPVPGGACKIFPKTNVWNTDISTVPVHPKSAQWLASMNSGSTNLHPDFGAAPYGFPYAVVDNSHPTVTIKFVYADESDPGPYPFCPDIPLEQGSDKHALMINKDTCVLYELYAASWNNGDPKAGSGAVFPLRSNALRPDGWTSADAAGMPIFAGLVRWDEVQAGLIGHAIRMTAHATDASHLWPARHDAGTPNTNLPPMGARFRLKASYDISHFSPAARVILLAMQRYGMFITDNGTDWYFQGTLDSHWTDGLLDELKSVPASQFEAVDESGLMINPDSGKAKQP